MRGWSGAGSVRLILVREMRSRRHVNVQAAQFHPVDVDGLPAFVVQRCVKAELGQVDQRPGWNAGVRCNTGDLGRRPDAQAFALGPKAVHQRDVKAVELDAGVKMVLEALDDERPQDRSARREAMEMATPKAMRNNTTAPANHLSQRCRRQNDGFMEDSPISRPWYCLHPV